LWPAVLVVFIILSIHSILVSHRIAGPLYRFRQTFQQIIAGDISKMARIRKGDLLANEQEKIAEMMMIVAAILSNVSTLICFYANRKGWLCRGPAPRNMNRLTFKNIQQNSCLNLYSS